MALTDRPDDAQRREVRRMLRAGLPRALCERYLAGSRLARLLQHLAWRFPIHSFDDVLKTHYAAALTGVLTRKSPLLALLAGTWKPTYGRWR